MSFETDPAQTVAYDVDPWDNGQGKTGKKGKKGKKGRKFDNPVDDFMDELENPLVPPRAEEVSDTAQQKTCPERHLNAKQFKTVSSSVRLSNSKYLDSTKSQIAR